MRASAQHRVGYTHLLRVMWLLAACLTAVPALAWKPEKQIEILAAAAPGGGYDTTARTIQRIFQSERLVEVPVIVTNKPGGGGNIGYTYFSQKAGDASVITIMSPTVMGNYITGKSTMNYTDFTPVATLYNESIGFATKSDSPIKTGKDFIERLKKDPQSISIGLGISLGNALHVAAALIAKSAGVDVKKLKVVVFNSQGEVIAAGLGGHVDVIVTRPSNMVAHLQNGSLHAFGVTAAARETGPTATIPTWREQGVDVVYSNWFAVLAPKGISADALAYWDEVFEHFVRSNAWKEAIEKYRWTPDYRNSRATKAFFDAQYGILRDVLGDLGLAKR
jgi:putative tricarboxylic transport membrane protein